MEEWIDIVKNECTKIIFEQCLNDNNLIVQLCNRLNCSEWELMSAFSELFE